MNKYQPFTCHSSVAGVKLVFSHFLDADYNRNSTMAAFGSIVFCTDCGNLLDGSTGDKTAILVCDVCGARNKDTASTSTTTTSKSNAFPSALRQKRSAVQTLTEDDVRIDAEIDHPCPECGEERMRYYTQQLRSADEGSTVFYSCENCGHKSVHPMLIIQSDAHQIGIDLARIIERKLMSA